MKIKTIFWIINLNLDNNFNFLGWIKGYIDSFPSDNPYNILILYPSSKTGRLTYINDTFSLLSFYKPKIFNKIEIDFISYFSVKKSLRILFKKYNPNFLHLFGSEFIHSYIAAKIFNKSEKTILHIQGIVSELYKVYDSDLSFINRISFSFSDFIRGNIVIQKYKYKLKSIFEKKLLRSINFVTGRTKWDKDISHNINNKLTYFHLNENLRDLFYQNKNKPKNHYDGSDKIIFYLSQAAYPVKGLHLFLPIMSYLKNSGLNVELNITGKNFSKSSFFSNSYYQNFLLKKIKQYNLNANINFHGFLKPKQVISLILKSTFVISSSLIENSSNIICESQFLGVPVLANNVGGTASLISNNRTGFLFNFKDVIESANRIIRIINNNQLLLHVSENSIRIARKRHNRTINTNKLISIYEKLL